MTTGLTRLLFVTLTMVGAAVQAAGASGIIYVDGNADQEPHDGSDWCHAFVELHEALAIATFGTEIRIADGVYRPSVAGLSDPRTATFELRSGTRLCGGFAGCGAADPNVNNPAIYATVLSGDIGVSGNRADNCYHVVSGDGVSGSTIVEGVIITGGNADGDGASQHGGGMLLMGGAPIIRHCSFVENQAVFGGGMFNFGGFPSFEATVFEGNSVSGSGGAAYNYDATWEPPPTFVGCVFAENTAAGYAGAMRNYDSFVAVLGCEFRDNLAGNSGGAVANGGWVEATFTRCRFEQNRADTLFAPYDSFGGAMYNTDTSDVTLVSCAFGLNVANSTLPGISYGGALAQSDDVSLTITNCTLAGHYANVGHGLYSRGAATVTVTNSVLFNDGDEIVNEDSAAADVSYSAVAGSWPGPGNTGDDPLLEALRLQPGSPGIGAGDPGYVPAAGEQDLDGHARVLCDRVDMGAFEFGLGDFDCTETVDLVDFVAWCGCMTGPAGGPYAGGCVAFDSEYDGDVDAVDLLAFQQLFGLAP